MTIFEIIVNQGPCHFMRYWESARKIHHQTMIRQRGEDLDRNIEKKEGSAQHTVHRWLAASWAEVYRVRLKRRVVGMQPSWVSLLARYPIQNLERVSVPSNLQIQISQSSVNTVQSGGQPVVLIIIMSALKTPEVPKGSLLLLPLPRDAVMSLSGAHRLDNGMPVRVSDNCDTGVVPPYTLLFCA